MIKNYKLPLTLFFYFLFLAGIFSAFSQGSGTQIATLTWENDPEQFPQDLVILGDPGYIYLHVMLENDPANNAAWSQPRIKIDLPAGIDFSQETVIAGTRTDNILITEPELTPTSRFTANTAPTGLALAGTRSLTLAYVYNGNTLALGDSIVIKIRIRALWEANPLNPGQVTVTMSSNTGQSLLGGFTKTCQLNLLRPTLRIRPTPGFDEVVIYDKILDTMLVSVDIDAQNGYTRSAYIAYTYNSNFVYLDSFKIDGKDLPLLLSNSGPGVFHNVRITGTELPGLSATQITYIRLDQSVLEGNITDVPRTLTFRATANRGCKWELTPWIQNPLVPNVAPSVAASYDRWNTNVTTLSLPGVRGAPTFNSQNISGAFSATNNPVIMRTIPRFNMDDPTDLTIPPNLACSNPPTCTTTVPYHNNSFYSFCWDGETPNYATMALQNNNGVEAISLEFRTYLDYYADLSRCEYYDTTQIYYRVTCPSKIDGSDSIVTPVTRLLSTDVDFYGKLCIDATNNFSTTDPEVVAQYNSILWDKSRSMTLRLPGIGMDNPLPAGATVEFQWVIYGNPNWINDSYRSRSNFSIVNASYNYITNSWTAARYENTCGDVSTTGGAIGQNFNKPRFRSEAIPKMAVYSQQTFYWSNPTNPGSNNTTAVNNPASDPTGPRYAEYFVKMPDWLDLDTDGSIIDAFKIRPRDSVIFYGSNHPTNGTLQEIDANGYKTYSVIYNTGSTDVVLDIRLKPGDCPDEIVYLDTLQVWIDWVGGNLPSRAGEEDNECRGRFKKTSKVFTELEFICTPPALAIDTFGVFRITRGLKDSDNDHLPDDGTLALDEQIDHRHFLEGDTGYYFFRGYVGGTTAQRYDKLVLVLYYGTGGSIGATYQYKWGNATTAHTIPFWDEGTIEIKRWNEDKTDFTLFTLPLDIPVVSSQDSLIIYYDGGFNDYAPRGGDSCYIKVPFRCRLGYYGNIRGNFYCNSFGIRQNDPTQEWVSKYFPDGLYRIVFRSHTFQNRGSDAVFAFPESCFQQRVNELYAVSYYGGDEGSNWPYEVRYRHKLEKIVLRVPGGFARTNDKIYLRPVKWHSSTLNNVGDDYANQLLIPLNRWMPVVPDLMEEDFVTQDSIFTIDMTKYVDHEYDGSQGYSYDFTNFLLSNGKFTPGDDVGGVYCTFDSIFATPASIRTALTGTMTFINSVGAVQNQSIRQAQLQYAGRKLQMELQSSVLMFNQFGFSSIKITNANGLLTNNDTWLFVEGNVKDAFLVDFATKIDTIWGEGLNNCWLNIGTMAGGEIQNYYLVYEYQGKDACENDTVTVYSAFNASDLSGFSIDPELGIEQVHICNRGEKKYTVLDLLTARVKVAGHVTPIIPNLTKPGYIHHHDTYVVDYVINGKVSQGALNDASVTFRIPAGQVYVDTSALFGAACFEYPEGSGFRPIPTEILDELVDFIGTGSNHLEPRDYTIHIKDLLEKEIFMMPGWGYTPMNYQDEDRVFTIRIPLIPLCETDLTGIRFRAIFNGTTFCGAPCEDDGTVYITQTILSDVSPEYDFTVTITHAGDSRVFSNEQRSDTLIVTFKKEMGAGIAEIGEDDYVLLRLSENMTISGDITCNPFGTMSIDEEWVNDEEERYYKIYLPAAELNLLMLESPPQDTITFEYKIPVFFTPNLIDFDCSAPRQEFECQVVSEAYFDDPEDDPECDIMPFNIGSSSIKALTLDYDPDLYKVCLNMPNALTFACSSVTPIWYRDSVGTGGQLVADNTFIYTPTVYKDTTFWLRIVYDYNGPLEENFGLTYIKVTMHPLVKAQFSLPSLCVGQETTFNNESLVGGEVSDLTNTKNWYWYLNGSTEPFSTEREPTRVLEAGDVVKLKVISIDGCEDETSVTAAPYPLPLPTITGSLDTCYNQCLVYKTEPDMTDYVWTVSNGTAKTPLTGRDSLVVCWDQQSSPVFGYLGVVYTDGNGCIALPKNDIARIVVRIPPDIPEIEGNETPCLYSEYTYNFVHQDNIEDFYWTVTGGEIIGGGEGYNYITIKWTDDGPQEITLAIANRAGCVPVDIGRLPVDVISVTRPTVTGEEKLCLYSEGTYTTEDDMTGYAWYVDGGTIVSGTGTNEISVEWTETGEGKLAVRYYLDNGCLSYMIDTIYVTVDTLPVPTITGSSAECFKECAMYYTEKGMSNYVWTVTNGEIENDIDNRDSVKICWNDVYAPSTGTAKVTYTDGNGCRAEVPTAKENITIYGLPATPVISGNINPCFQSEMTYTFVNQPTFTITDYVWTVTTGADSIDGGTGYNFYKVKWTTPGTQTLTLAIIDNRGCIPDNVGELTVEVQPRVNVNFSADTVCFGFNTSFTDLTKLGTTPATTSNIESWNWYSDGDIAPFATEQNPEEEFTAGEHNIKLEVTDKYDCVGDTTIKILVRELPEPTVTGSDAECFKQCAMYYTQKGMSNYVWEVDNGTIDGATDRDSVKVCWNEEFDPEIGTVTVLYTDAKGCRATTAGEQTDIVIYPLPATPEIDGEETPCFNSEQTYKYILQTGFTVDKYIWTVNDGEIIAGGNTVNSGNGCDSVKVKWTTSGTQTITLTIIDDNGCIPDNVGELEIEVQPRVNVNFSADTVCVGYETSFTDLTKLGTTPATTSNIESWNWYSDGVSTPFATIQNPEEEFTAGEHTIKLEVTDKYDCVGDTTIKILVRELPEPTVTGSSAECFKQCAMYYTEKGMSNYVWEVDNGTIDGADNRDSVKVCWNEDFDPEVGTVTVLYTDTKGCRATTAGEQTDIVIYPLPATPEINGEETPCFNSEQTYKYILQTGFTVDKYIWTVNDGEILAGGNTVNSGNGCDSVKVKWTTSGTQTITLTIIDDNGCVPDNVGELTVEVQPRVNVNFSADTVCVGYETSFTDLTKLGTTPATSSNIESWNWYSDSDIAPFATIQNPKEEFTAGEHTIKLEVTDKYDCVGDTTIKILVRELPEPTVTGSDAECFKQCAMYYTEKGMSNYVWEVDNGTIDGTNDRDSVKVCWNVDFDPELGTVSVLYTDAKGCRATTAGEQTDIVIYPLPATPEIDGEETPCFNSEQTYTFTPQPPFTITDYVWTVTGADSIDGGTGYNFYKVKWTTLGTQTLTLTIIDDNGCIPDNVGELEIEVQPRVNVNFSADTVCVGYETSFTDLTKLGTIPATSSNIESWNWYSDGDITPFAAEQNPEEEFTAGEHNIKLVVTDKYDCVGDTTIKILVRELPEPTVSGSGDECFKQCAMYYTEKGMSNYVWEVDNGTIDGANNRDSVKVCWNDDFDPELGTVTVLYTDAKGCRATTAGEQTGIVIYPLPATPEIESNSLPCIGTEVTYSYVNQPLFNIVNYTWTVSGGTVVEGGTGEDHITVKWDSFGKFEISLSVIDDNGCIPDELGVLEINVNGAYPTITGSKMACIAIPETYTTQSGMNNYEWHIEGGIILNGNNSNQIKVEWKTPGKGKLSVKYLNQTIGCTLFMTDQFEVDVIPCTIANCVHLSNKTVTEDAVKAGYYTHLDTDWDLQPISGFTFDSVKYYLNSELYDEGLNPSLFGAKFPVRKTTVVTCVGYYYGIPDTCEFYVYVEMACPTSVSDIEEHDYDVVPLVGLCWTSNLMTTSYASGVPIAFANGYSCSICPDPNTNAAIFGLLYTWYSALGVPEGDNFTDPESTQGICPQDWRLPTMEELNLLNKYNAAELKSIQYWLEPGNNKTEFNSLPAGMYNGNTQKYQDLYGFTGYWSSDVDVDVNVFAFYYSLNYYCDIGNSIKSNKTDAFSVRCVMNFEEE